MSRTISTSSSNVPQWEGISCVLVAQNDQHNLIPTLDALTEALNSQRGSIIGEYEIVVVDDGSRDQTGVELLRLQKANSRLRVVRHIEPEGVGAAFYSGLTVARYPLIFFSTADNRFDYRQIGAFLSYIEDYDAVIGYRPERQDPFLRKTVSSVWNFLVAILFGWRLRDIDCAFKLFRRDSFKDLNLTYLRSRDSIVNTELLTYLRKKRKRVLEAPVTHFPQSHKYGDRVSIPVIGRAIWRILGLRARLTVQALWGYFGFITGIFSRTERPMEVVVYRRSEELTHIPDVVCRLCGAGREAVRKTQLQTSEDLVELGEYSVFYCTACHNGFTVPLPPESTALLTPDVPSQKLPWLQRFLLKRFIQIRAQRVLRAARNSSSCVVLDIGGGNCAFGNELAHRGLKVTVVEPNPANQIYADTERGVRFVASAFTEDLIESGIVGEGQFDVVTMWHSLEHVPDPVKTLQLAWRVLKPGGCLYVCVPNLNSLQADLSQNRWTYLDVPHHLTHFTLDGIVAFIRQSGFSEINIHWFSPEYEIFGFYQTFLNMASLSHNYYYNRAKKGKESEKDLRHPAWTKLVTTVGFIFLPVSMAFALIADLSGKSACVEAHCYKESSQIRLN